MLFAVLGASGPSPDMNRSVQYRRTQIVQIKSPQLLFAEPAILKLLLIDKPEKSCMLQQDIDYVIHNPFINMVIATEKHN